MSKPEKHSFSMKEERKLIIRSEEDFQKEKSTFCTFQKAKALRASGFHYHLFLSD